MRPNVEVTGAARLYRTASSDRSVPLGSASNSFGACDAAFFLCYVNWIKRFIQHFGKRHPGEMGADEIQAFPTHLAVAVLPAKLVPALCAATMCRISPYSVPSGRHLLEMGCRPIT